MKAKRHMGIQTDVMPTLPKREILCLTRAASLQNRLEKKDGKSRIEQKASERTKKSKECKVSKEIRKGLMKI